MELVGFNEELRDVMELVDCNKEMDDDIDFAKTSWLVMVWFGIFFDVIFNPCDLGEL